MLNQKGYTMKKLSLTISGLQENQQGIVTGSIANIKVYQGETLLVEDRFVGKATAPYTKIYDVDVGAGELNIEHDRHDLSLFKVSVNLF